jgi:hypothetical protein
VRKTHHAASKQSKMSAMVFISRLTTQAQRRRGKRIRIGTAVRSSR